MGEHEVADLARNDEGRAGRVAVDMAREAGWRKDAPDQHDTQADAGTAYEREPGQPCERARRATTDRENDELIQRCVVAAEVAAIEDAQADSHGQGSRRS